MERALVGIIMGSVSDKETMARAEEILDELGVAYESRIVSAHRTPDWMFEYASTAEARGVRSDHRRRRRSRSPSGHGGIEDGLPVIGVPVRSSALSGLDSLLSIVQMPAGVPGGDHGHRRSRSRQRRLLAARILGIKYPELRERLHKRSAEIARQILEQQ